jgi:AraC family transcriptional regulator of arabinose operon
MAENVRQNGIAEKELYVNSGYLFNSRVPFREKKLPLRILSAGTYKLYSVPRLPTLRPRGRVDWQIIYIAAGKGHFILDGKEVIVPAGSMVLFQPKQVQDYFYYGKDKTQVWFVHFTGREVRNILRHYEIPTDGYILHTGISREYEDLFRRMRDELVRCSWGYEEMLTYLFRELLMTMHRRMTENAPRVSGFIQDEIDRARAFFDEHYNEEISIEQYAVSRNMSTSWFNRSFRSAVGTSPMQYILDVRIRNAQTLLETTDYSVTSIAALVGYENPMYFSRLFRKAKGLSPSKYRKTFREKFMEEIKGAEIEG